MNLPIQVTGNMRMPILVQLQTGILPTQLEAGSLAINRCALRPNPGQCLAYFPKYYYDQNEKRCRQFIWGGCGGTVPFNTLQECERSCGCGCRN